MGDEIFTAADLVFLKIVEHGGGAALLAPQDTAVASLFAAQKSEDQALDRLWDAVEDLDD